MSLPSGAIRSLRPLSGAEAGKGRTMEIVQSIVGSFLIALPALFSIVNPPGGALIYNQVTAGRSHAERV